MLCPTLHPSSVASPPNTGQSAVLVRQVSDMPGFSSVVGFRFAFCLLGFGSAMEEALLPSKWLYILSLRVFRLSGDLESRSRLRGRDLQPAVPFARLYSRTLPGQEVRQRLLRGCMPLWASRGQGIQLWPHSLTNDFSVCRSDTEQILRHPLAVAR